MSSCSLVVHIGMSQRQHARQGAVGAARGRILRHTVERRKHADPQVETVVGTREQMYVGSDSLADEGLHAVQIYLGSSGDDTIPDLGHEKGRPTDASCGS